jgi:hypothetical protein
VRSLQTVGYPALAVSCRPCGLFAFTEDFFFYSAYKFHTQSRDGGGTDTTMNNLNGMYDDNVGYKVTVY